MKNNVVKRNSGRNFVYESDLGYIATANFTFRILFREIKVFSKTEKLILRAKQYDWRYKIISIFPWLQIRNLFYVQEKCPFHIYGENNESIGSVVYLGKYKLEARINNQLYHLQLHNDNIVSICKNDIPVAKIDKDYIHSWRKSKFMLSYLQDQDASVMFLLTLIADLVLFDFSKYIFAFGPSGVLYDDKKELGKWECE